MTLLKTISNKDGDKIKLRWSKPDKDWKFQCTDRKGYSMMGVFFDLIKTKGHRMDWKETLEDMLTERGYDYTTLTITCKKKKNDKG